MPEAPSFETRCAHAGDSGEQPVRPIAPQLFLASVFETVTLDETDRAMRLEPGHYSYSRDANPTVVALEQAVAALEGGDAALAMASGMGAISTLFVALLSPGDHVVIARELYGATAALLSTQLTRYGISMSSAEVTDAASFEAAMRPETKLLFVETVSNPLMRVADVPPLAEIAHRHGALVAVDASFTTPALSTPLAQGADLVVHSATKYLSGHSDVTAGAVAGDAATIERLRPVRKLFGPACSPMDAWLTLRGIKTLALRVERHTSNAAAVAEYLARHQKVRRVYYSGLAGDPQHALATRVLPRGAGGMLSFEIDGGTAAVDRFMSGLSLVRFAASLADVTTTISHPALTSHRAFTPDERAALGISDGLIRLSVGIESVADICADLERGLAVI
jgi:cystathionine beta-lyase/cystathionine gamma-synthase